MVASRKIAVDITGNPADLEKALNRASVAAKQFGKQVEGAAVTGPLSRLDRGFDALDSKLRVRARRAQSLGPLRLAGIGLGAGTAIFAATQAASKLGDAIEVTGRKAFTTEGHIRNFAASLLSGDIVGGIQALDKIPKTLDEAGISATFALQHLKEFEGLAGAGGPFAQLGKQAVAAANAIKVAAAAQDALNFSLRTTNQLASGALVPFVGRPEEGVGSPGAVAAAQALNRATGGTTPGKAFRPIGPGAKNAAAQIIAQAAGNLPELLRLQQVELARATKAFTTSHGNTKQREALKLGMANAQAAVITTQKEITAQAEQSAADAKNAAEKAKADRAAARAKHQAALEAARRAAAEFQKQLMQAADDLKSAALRSLDRTQTKRNLGRELQQAQEKLRLAQRIGSPGAVTEARQNIADIRTERLRFLIEGARVTPTRMGPRGQVVGGAGFTVHIGTINLPGVKNANQLLRELQRIPVATSRRGRYGGTKNGI